MGKLNSVLKSMKWPIRIGVGLGLWSAAGLAFWGGAATPFYRVKTQHAVVKTHLDGERSIDYDVGIHSRITTNPIVSATPYSLRTEFLYLDEDNTPHRMQAKDSIQFEGAGMFTYKITDLDQFGIRIGNQPTKMLNSELDGLAKDYLQAHPVEELVSDRETINQEIMGSTKITALEEKYGVDIISFTLTHSRYTPEMTAKMVEAKGIKIEGLARKEAAKNHADAKRTVADADKYYIDQQMAGLNPTNQEEKLAAYETIKDMNLTQMLKDRPAGENTYIFRGQGGKDPNLTLPAKGVYREVKQIKPKAKTIYIDDKKTKYVPQGYRR